MSDREKALVKLPARPVTEVLEDLARLHDRTKAVERGNLPRVTLHLTSGRDLSGWLIDLAEQRRPGVLLLRASGDPRQQPVDATYVEPRTIEAITVHDAAPYAPTLSRGTVAGPLLPPPGAGAPPSRLELRRRLEADARRLSDAVGKPIALEVRWDEVAEGGEHLRVLEAVVDDTVEVLLAIAREDMGKEALAAMVSAVSFGDGGGKGVLLEKNTLAVSARLELGTAGRLEKTELRSAIERLL